jgi:hypothetical protein
MKFLLIFLWLIFSGNLFAADPMVREHVLRASMLSYTTQIKPTPIWVSSVKIESNPTYFVDSAGSGIMARPNSVVSAYDSTSTRYGMSDMYSYKSDRYKLVSHINGFSKGEIFSIGYDSGINTDKLNMNNSLYAGYTRTVSMTNKSLTALSLGAWFGGSIKENPCLDSYGRQYSCQTLTAWGDYKPRYPTALAFIDIRHIWIFD